MDFTTIEIAGKDAVRLLQEHRAGFPSTGQYPFLIGNGEELERIKETAEFNDIIPSEIIKTSLDIRITDWIAEKQKEAEEDGFSNDENEGEWPGNVADKGSIGLHKDVLTGKIISKVYLGLARIEKPWQLPAVLKYGAWNDCPSPEVHCAFFREWNERYGAEITGMSGDVIECVVKKPPITKQDAMILAREQYAYCDDIVDQGCETISVLAATLLNSPYWYFWWD